MAAPAGSLAQEKSTGPALGKGEIIQMLKNGMEPAQLGQMARQYGVSFEMTPETAKELRDAGASDSLITLLKEVAPKPAAPKETPAPEPAPAASPVLLIDSKPGGAQVYVDDEPVGKAGPEGRLKLSTLSAGQHRLRLSLEGYKDNEQSFEMRAGETVRMVVSLEAVPPPAPAPQPLAPAPTQPTSAPTRTAPRVVQFPVAHFHHTDISRCHGWLIVGNGRVKYQTSESDHSFDAPLSEIAEARLNPTRLKRVKGFHIKMLDGTNYNLALHRAGRWEEPDEIFEAIERARVNSGASEASGPEESEPGAEERASRKKEKRGLLLGRRSRK